PIWPHTSVGQPPMEDYWLGHATERIFLPLLKLTIPEIVDIHMPAAGIFHNLVFVSIDKQYPGQAYKVMNGLWGQGLMSLAKVIVVFDQDVNVQDPREAWWVALYHIDPARDVLFTLGPIGVPDHSSRGFSCGSEMGLAATRKPRTHAPGRAGCRRGGSRRRRRGPPCSSRPRCLSGRRGRSTRSASRSRPSRWCSSRHTVTPSASLPGRTCGWAWPTGSRRRRAIWPSPDGGATRGGCSWSARWR